MSRPRRRRFLLVAAGTFLAQLVLGFTVFRKDQSIGYQVLIAILIALTTGTIAAASLGRGQKR